MSQSFETWPVGQILAVVGGIVVGIIAAWQAWQYFSDTIVCSNIFWICFRYMAPLLIFYFVGACVFFTVFILTASTEAKTESKHD